MTTNLVQIIFIECFMIVIFLDVLTKTIVKTYFCKMERKRESERVFQNSNLADNGNSGSKSVEGLSLKSKEVCGDKALGDFIMGHKDLLDVEVFLKFCQGNEQALKDALNQIHWRSLIDRSKPEKLI